MTQSPAWNPHIRASWALHREGEQAWSQQEGGGRARRELLTPPTQSLLGKETSVRTEDGARERKEHAEEGRSKENVAFPRQVGAP